MHIPNGLLDPKVSAGAAFAAAGALGYCFAKVKQAISRLEPAFANAGNIGTSITDGSKKIFSTFAENHIMRMGAIASLIFAAQMFNFPINNGTSGHLMGGVLAAIAVGPFSGALVIAAILTIQSIFFADGGLMALGANILNMAVIGSFVSYYIYYAVNSVFKNKFGFYVGVSLAAFFSVVFAAASCAFEISLSGTIELSKILPAMLSVHSIIGIAEALLTIIAIDILRNIKFELDGEVKSEE
jgi:cobalt/nickel transport system permease protein